MPENFIEVGQVGDDGKVILTQDKFRKTVDSNTTISEYTMQKIDSQWHLVGTGTSGGTNCYMVCWPAQFTPEGKVAVNARTQGQGCIGNNCSRCSITLGNCQCESGGGNCNHFITTAAGAGLGLEES